MTERHDDDSWSPEDDELVRRALMSLMDDVSSAPLPEPAQVRARAEGNGRDAPVVDLASRRRRSLALLAGAAAAVIVATGAGLLVINQDPDTPVATSTTEQPTPTSTASSSAAPSRLTALGPGEWQAFLGIDVESTVAGEPAAHCFRPSDDSSWRARSAQQDGGSRVAGQWVGTSPRGTGPLTESVDRSVDDCDGYTQEGTMSERLSDGTVRAWHNQGPEGGVWWVEVSDGTSASFLSVTEEEDRTYSEADIRHLARGVLGEVDLTRPTSSSTSSSASSPTSTTDAPSTSTSTSTTSSPSSSDPDGTSTSSSSTSSPTPPVNSPTPPDQDAPVVGPVPSSSFIAPSRWSSQTLTGGEAAVGGRLETEGDGLTIDPCASGDGASAVGGLGIRSGWGEDTFFGRQYVLEHDSSRRADQQMTNLRGMYSTDCGGASDTRRIDGGDDETSTYAMTQGDLTTYVALVRQGSTDVTILHLTTAKTAPEPLTDTTAVRELERLAEEARG